MGLWKEINKETKQLKHYCSFKIGDRSRIKLWEDVWFGENTLMAIFPSIYAMAGTKVQGWRSFGSQQGWRVAGILGLRDIFMTQELEEIQRFISTISKNSISPGSTNSLIWKGA